MSKKVTFQLLVLACIALIALTVLTFFVAPANLGGGIMASAISLFVTIAYRGFNKDDLE